ncbi:hypothetical protein [Cellulomonas sp. IC4_254]|uniref:hypothetical protein n=1 Tax=Cellulomonas sp. IC4_254 TaxID=2714040 RepID=UPI00141F0D71|nr:hypothetical protein [Cellulomonas sp. IC4_254]NHT17266.1 hypothetical protein [Cellulomonas sp. IC4_254]
MTGGRGERPRMRLAAVVDEALRDLAARWLLSLLVAAVALAAGTSTVLLAAGEVDGIRATWDDQVAEGRFVQVVAGARSSGVDAAACAAVGGWTGVRAAGGRIGTEPVRFATSPASRYDHARVTPGYVQVLWPGAPEPLAGEVVVGPHAAASAGLRSGSTVVWSAVATGNAGLGAGARPDRAAPGAVSAVVAAVPARGTARDPAADRQVLSVVPAAGTVDRCVVDVDPARASAVLPALRTWFGDGVDAPRPVVDLARAVDPDAELAGRASAWWWALAASITGAAAAAAWVARRADVALHRLLGADPGTVALRLTVDVGVTVVTPVLLGTATAVVVTAPALAHEVVRTVVLADAARLLVVSAALPVLGLVLVGRGSVFRILKES